MAVGLFALYLAFRGLQPRWALEALYFFAEYVALFLLYVGMTLFPNQIWRWNLSTAVFGLTALVIALGLSQTFAGFDQRFQFHALLFALALLPTIWRLVLLPIGPNQRWVKTWAISVTTALMLLFLINGVGFIDASILGERLYAAYSAYQSIYDLMIESVLAFALLTIAAVDAKVSLERANQSLLSERDRMVMLAHRDALTGCFNRLALDELQQRINARRGVVAMVDLNNLKPINDQYGHQTGDMAICRVANSLQTRMRGHDHIFRFGGDEFVVVAFNMTRDEVHLRLRLLQQQLSSQTLTGVTVPMLSIAWGLAEFEGDASFVAAISAADKQMYSHKQQMRPSPTNSDEIKLSSSLGTSIQGNEP